MGDRGLVGNWKAVAIACAGRHGVRNELDARACVEDALTRAEEGYKRKGITKPEEQRRWFYRVLRNVCREWVRRQGPSAPGDFDPDVAQGREDSPEAVAIQRDLVRKLSERLTPRRCRVLLLLVDGYSQQEIAVKLGVSEPTISHERQAIRAAYRALEGETVIRC